MVSECWCGEAFSGRWWKPSRLRSLGRRRQAAVGDGITTSRLRVCTTEPYGSIEQRGGESGAAEEGRCGLRVSFIGVLRASESPHFHIPTSPHHHITTLPHYHTTTLPHYHFRRLTACFHSCHGSRWFDTAPFSSPHLQFTSALFSNRLSPSWWFETFFFTTCTEHSQEGVSFSTHFIHRNKMSASHTFVLWKRC
ncbi:hypothetical protein AOQ84DRAFT_195951 [Glonium stellatum]|uniref:Uncharacterized protein n=1 Tax=Glonium stellatum TaxID=574774 RepID=A0A8E2ENL9_9PEZI|nr:hypothetical protein AOQ84DRAFT_195951 [Glonium stellatum]